LCRITFTPPMRFGLSQKSSFCSLVAWLIPSVMPYDNPDFFTLWQCFVLVTLAPQSLRVNSFRLF
jgi:hypothetical protein